MYGPIFLRVASGNLNSGIPPATLKHATVISSQFFKASSSLTLHQVPTENQSIALLRAAGYETCDVETLTHSEPFGDPITELKPCSLPRSSSLPPLPECVSITTAMPIASRGNIRKWGPERFPRHTKKHLFAVQRPVDDFPPIPSVNNPLFTWKCYTNSISGLKLSTQSSNRTRFIIF